ncbi:uncharacterized protein [Mytilus edulis]
MKICLNEEKSLITCFWTTTLPKGDTSGQKLMTENDALRNELYATRTKYELMSKLVHDAEERLHASNRQKQTMEDIIYKQYDKILNGLIVTGQYNNMFACEKDNEGDGKSKNKF